ncbi:MAG TPA: hypothetical protein VJT71_07180 [Pyrinomonadaceae bacterium]|nr:hypothetical protein [Pyrinomonadaceae bacterium]
MILVRMISIILALLLLPSFMSGQTKARSDVWEPLRYLVGKWEGTGNGQPGMSKVQREYRLVLNDKFLHVQNRSVYDPQPKNPKGEIHEDWGMISFDKSRKQFVMRQFHVEGFVNQYVNTSTSTDGKTIVFISESIENIPTGYRARETYKILSADEFSEVFEIAEPGKDFEAYSEGHFKRKK